MGHLAALTNAWFETKPDGTQLFFPWGGSGRGYVVPSAREAARLRRGVAVFVMVGIPLGAAVASGWGLGIGFAFVVLTNGLFVLWLRAQSGRLEQSDERRSLREGDAGPKPVSRGAVGLCVLQMLSTMFLLLAPFLVARDPRGACAAIAIGIAGFVALGLVARRRRKAIAA